MVRTLSEIARILGMNQEQPLDRRHVQRIELLTEEELRRWQNVVALQYGIEPAVDNVEGKEKKS